VNEARRYFTGFSSEPFAGRNARLARRSATRSITWLMSPRRFSGVVAAGAWRTGGEIFSNVNAGIVCPLAFEMNHLLEFPCYSDDAQLLHPLLHSSRMELFKHSPCQMRPQMRLHCGLISMILN
jgi:hypothetical protein